jgi:periplasmic copper chaperone A
MIAATRRLPALIVLILAWTAAVAAGGRAHALHIEAPWSRATPPGVTTGVAYLTIRNDGAAADRLLAASSPQAESVEIHQTSMVDGEMQMRERQDLPVPPGAVLRFEPGGYHLMLVGLKAPLVAGGRATLTLRFERAGPITVELPVAAAGAPAPGM